MKKKSRVAGGGTAGVEELDIGVVAAFGPMNVGSCRNVPV